MTEHSSQHPQHSLRKSISWLAGTAMTIAAVVGTGVLILPGVTARLAGPASLLAWLVMGLLTVPMALTLGRLAARLPDAGGIASYARRAFGPSAGAVTGWLYLGTVPIGAPIAALIGVSYISSVIEISRAAGCAIAIVMIAISIFLNLIGIQLAGLVQSAIVAIILLILVSAIIVSFPHSSNTQLHPFAPNGYAAVGTALTILFWAFVGWEMMSHLTEEFKNPKDIMISVWLTIVIVNVVYLGVAWVTVGTGVYREQTLAPLAQLIAFGWGKEAGAVVGALGFLLSFGSIHTYVAGFTRLVYAQAVKDDFPRWFGKLHPQFHTPHRAILSLGLITVFVLLAGYIFQIDLVPLMQLPSSVFVALYIIAMSSAVKLAGSDRKLRILACFALVLCLCIFPFNGWVMLYPIGIGTVGALYHWYQRSKQVSTP